ncbi:MAG: hypothetical protein M1483_08110 [Actinobacteria bacterium]|nr:hypothetical protein [Actinomycetota bacterium]
MAKRARTVLLGAQMVVPIETLPTRLTCTTTRLAFAKGDMTSSLSPNLENGERTKTPLVSYGRCLAFRKVRDRATA